MSGVSPPAVPTSRGRGAVLVLLAAALFGTTGTAAALGPAGESPLAIGAGRLVLGGLLLTLVARLAGELSDGRHWSRPAQCAAAAGVALYQVAFFAGVGAAGVAVGTIVTIGSAPAFTGLLGWAAGQGRPGRWWVVATGLAVAGGALLVSSGSADARAEPAGVAMALLAGAAYAVYTVAAKRLLDDGHRPVGVMGRSFGFGAVLLLPVLVLTGPGPLAEPGVLLVVLYLAVVPTLLAYVLFARGLAVLPAATVATLTLAEPLVAGLLGVFALDEPVTAARLAGAGLVLLGLVVLGTRAGR